VGPAAGRCATAPTTTRARRWPAPACWEGCA
jgi:hypothetical protein